MLQIAARLVEQAGFVALSDIPLSHTHWHIGSVQIHGRQSIG
jgi:hypothetical protein